MRRDLLEGTMSVDSYALQMGGISQLEKQQKLMLAGMVAENKLKKKLPLDLNRGVLSMKQEKHECVDRDIIITRENCLDYSGSKENHEQCRSCQYFKINRNLLTPRIGTDSTIEG